MNKPFYILFLLFSLCFCCETKSQTNLIYNGDFEIYDTCPQSIASPGFYQVEHCLGWRTPTYATSDYFNNCNGGSIVGTPYNSCGFQQPKNGTAYCGFYACSYPSVWWFEYIQGELITNLIAGKKYTLSFFVSCADGASNIAIKKIGAYFSSTQISRSDAYPFPFKSQILNKNLIKDTMNWIKIEGSFNAIGNEKYITIGYFGDTLLTDTVRFQNFSSSNEPNSYYYIDDVTLIESNCDIVLPNIFSPNNDGINDKWKLPYGLQDYQITFYNRWGQEIIKSDANGFEWDGKNKKGEDCVDGTYYFIIENKNDIQNSLKGFLQLIH